MMPRTFALLVALATLSAGAQAQAQIQTADPASQGTPQVSTQNNNQVAPIVRTAPGASQRFIDTQPIRGVWVHAEANSSLKTVSTGTNSTELRLERGRANIQVHHPAQNSQILIDLPGGQVSLLKDGFYTFNAETNTVRVLRGEAETAVANAKPIKIKEDHELSFAPGLKLKSVEDDPQELASDVLPRAGGFGPGYGYGPGYGPYGDGYYPGEYPYPYVAYGWGYPYPYWGWGYPYGFGVGFYGGFGGFYGGRFRR